MIRQPRGVDHTLENFTAALHTDEVAARLAELVRIGHGQGVESAFAVYDSGVVSQVTSPDAHSGEQSTRYGALQVDMSTLIGNELDGTDCRDVLLTVHTHPASDRYPDGKPVPSTTDTGLFNRLSLEAPHMINGVLTWSESTPAGAPGFSLRGLVNAAKAMRGGNATLLLTRHNATEYHRFYNDPFFIADTPLHIPEYGPGNETLESYSAYADSRAINYAHVAVHPRTGAIIDDSQLPHLFYDGPASVLRQERF